MDGSSHYFGIEKGPRTHYTQHGNLSGPLLICLHGLGGSVATFTRLLPYLPAKLFRIVCVDFEGFGKTPLSSASLSVENYVNYFDQLVSFLQGPSRSRKANHLITIIGHNLGSIVALHYTARYPTRVAGLGLLGVGRSASHIPVARQRMLRLAETVRSKGIGSAATLAMTSNFAAGESNQDGRRDYVRNEVAASDPDAYAMVCEALVSPEHVDPDYVRIKCPVVLVSGIGDVISPPGKAHEMRSLLSGETMVEVVRGGHQPILSDLEGTTDAIGELFRLIETKQSSI